ncbi:MAG: hypothetical protein GY856_38200 [bacterium]|nr:hypothetical protein [bacterium]
MMFNEKQVELSQMLFAKVKDRFPEVELVDITETAYNPSNIWVNITMPSDEDRLIELEDVSAEISTDILLDYGYHITISSA